ncbi:MAG: LysR substrate-binding domain-containing protein [Corynebacterium variabile]|nr:LysR substrate-binding domain-containing protein [Corynebacterium variabile]MDN6813133.1 LysR substrate-binding domain-containing protein [Corynebacterium variabile]
MLATYANHCPNVDVSLRTGTTDELIRDVLEYRLDAAFVSGPVDAAELQQRTVFEEELVLVSARNSDDPADTLLRHLADDPLPVIGASSMPRLLVFRNGCSYRNRLIELAGTKLISTIPIIEFGSLEGILGCVAAGMGVTLLPAAVVHQSVIRERLRIHSLPKELGRAETLFIRRSDSPLGPAMRRFNETLDLIAERSDLRSAS